jgi:ABC-type nickel/cobalt efflux system permease component RcnA
MSKRKRHFIKRETLKRETLKKAKKDKLIGFIIMILMGIVACIASPFIDKVINNENMYSMFFLTYLPLMLIVTIFAAFIIWGMLKKKN